MAPDLGPAVGGRCEALPEWIAPGARLEGSSAVWDVPELARVVAAEVSALRSLPRGAVVGLLCDNGPEWIAFDLAAQHCGRVLVPLPAFFTSEQLQHVVAACGMDAIVCETREQAASLGFDDERASGSAFLRLFVKQSRERRRRPVLPPDARKITFTSGTTANPKGVVLTTDHQLHAARGLASALAHVGVQRHLCVLPLPVLLENVAGAYTALILGATCLCPPLETLGVAGASGFDASRCLRTIEEAEPDSMILLPQMLAALVACMSSAPREPRLRSLRFVAVGGGKTPAALIAAARRLGLPVYEGYGLTECASVVSVNIPGADRVGTVGRPLPPLRVRVAADGELEVAGRACEYLGSPERRVEWFPTGDLGEIDSDGFVTIRGRKKNVLITSFARNVSPEWPESLLVGNPAIAQAAVFGEARPRLVALLVPASTSTSDAALAQAVAAANVQLPDYARIGRWTRAEEPFTAKNGLATVNGRTRREAVWARYRDRLSALYGETASIDEH